MRRLLLWTVGMFVLGEFLVMRETDAGIRALVCIIGLCAAVLRLTDETGKVFMEKRKSRGMGKISLLFLLAFGLGVLRMEAERQFFSEPERAAFFSRYESRNPGEFDYGLYLKGLGISDEKTLSEYRDPERLMKSPSPYLRGMGRLRKRFAAVIDRHMQAEDAGIYRALLLGDKSMMDEEVRELYQSQGIAHLLAVSGLHMGIIGMGIFSLIRFFGASLPLSAGISAFLIVSYGILCGAQGSAVRAVVMLLLRLLAMVRGRSFDVLTALSAAAGLLCAAHPYVLLQSGFQLSFGAVLAISYLAERVTAAMERPCRGQRRKRLPVFGKTMIVSLSVQLFTLPVILYHYFSFPLYGIFLNLLVIPLMSYVIYSGLLTVGAGLLPSAAVSRYAGLFTGAGHYILRFYEWLCVCSAELPGAVLTPGRPEGLKMVLYYLFLFLLTEALCRLLCGITELRKRIFFGAGFFLVLTALSVLCFFVKPPERELSVTAIDVGQGDGFLIEYRGCTVLLDAGSASEKELVKYTLEPVLLSKGITEIDYAAVSHADKDHMSGILELLQEDSKIRVRTLLLPAAAEQGTDTEPPEDPYALLRAAGAACPGGIRYIKEGDQILFSKEGGPSITCLYEGRAHEEANLHSPALLLRYKAFSMLFTGDMGKKDEELFTEKYREVFSGLSNGQGITVYKAAHHGSKTSSSDMLLKLLRPRYALISYGKGNSYGHPHREVTERLSRYGVVLLRTGESGAVRFRTDGFRLFTDCFLKDDGAPEPAP